MSKIFERLLKKRGLTSDFLDLKYEDLSDPFILPDMDKAVNRIGEAIKTGQKILIYGDYDVDGVTATTVIADALTLSGVKSANLFVLLPNRFTDGYGMSARLVEEAKKQHIDLVITVDCGSRNHDIIDELNKLHIDTIVTDHHEVADTLPAAVAVVNPKRPDFAPVNGLEHLAGVGVAFKVASALRDACLLPDGQEKWLLDLVLIGTICDSMQLTGENRILCSYGFIVLQKTRRAGLQELMRLGRIKNLNSFAVGFQIGPRLNAAGRLESPDISLNLLRSRSPVEAVPFARRLEELNKKRKNEQLFAANEIKAREHSADAPVMVEAGNWHEGILGIIAGHLVDDYRRPAFAFTEVEGGILKGSGRSFGDFNLANALKELKDVIIGGGGHAAAAGLQIKKEQLNDFTTRINDYYRSLKLKNQDQFFKVTPDLAVDDLSEINLDLMGELAKLEPFGPGNEEPIFHLQNIHISSVTLMGQDKNHLRLDLCDNAGHFLKAICFDAPASWRELTPEHHIELLVKLVSSEFQGVVSAEARICDIIIL